jgi:hypothetical protein
MRRQEFLHTLLRRPRGAASGDYISIYDILRNVADKAMVPIYLKATFFADTLNNISTHLKYVLTYSVCQPRFFSL